MKSVHCPGDCLGNCTVGNNIFNEGGRGNSLHTEQGSTYSENTEDVHCPGHCSGACRCQVEPINEDITHSLVTVMGRTSLENVYNVQCARDIQGGGMLEGTLLPCKDPVNVGRPGWKSSQAAQGSGVFGKGGAYSSVHKGPGLDWTKWTGVVHEVEGSYINNVPGLKYCPGGELPVYEYTEYKPRCSKTRRTNYVYVQEVVPNDNILEEHEMEKSTKFEQGEAMDIVYVPEERKDQAYTVKVMVENWDRKEEMMEMVEMETPNPRRISENFKNLRSIFEKSDAGGIYEGGPELVQSESSVPDKIHPHLPKFKNFTEILGKFSQGDIKKSRPRQQKLCVVRQGVLGLVKLSTNEKRDRESDMNLPGLKTKKMRVLNVSPM